MRYHLQRDGNLLGPFSEAEIRELMANRAVAPHELAAPEGSNAFQELRLLFPTQPLNGSFGSTRANPALTPSGTLSASPDNRPSPIAEALATAAVYHPKTVSDLINDSYDMAREKARSWLIILLIPIAVSGVLFFQTIAASFDSMKGEVANQILQIPDFYQLPEVTPPQPVTPPTPALPLTTILLIFLNIYSAITAFAVIVLAAREYHEGSDYRLGELLGMAQRSAFYLCCVMLLLGMAESIIALPLFFGPTRFRLAYTVIAGLTLFFLTLRFFPLPFLIVLENTRLRHLFQLSWKLTRSQTPRLIRLCLVILAIQLFIAIAMLVNPFAGLMVLSINIFVLILSTLFFQDLWERAQLSP